MDTPNIPSGPATSAIRELAARIYVDFVGRVMLTNEKTKPNPVDLAKFCANCRGV
jgi:hypothetical protein